MVKGPTELARGYSDVVKGLVEQAGGYSDVVKGPVEQAGGYSDVVNIDQSDGRNEKYRNRAIDQRSHCVTKGPGYCQDFVRVRVK